MPDLGRAMAEMLGPWDPAAALWVRDPAGMARVRGLEEASLSLLGDLGK